MAHPYKDICWLILLYSMFASSYNSLVLEQNKAWFVKHERKIRNYDYELKFLLLHFPVF
jgi:hypothetical protein